MWIIVAAIGDWPIMWLLSELIMAQSSDAYVIIETERTID